MALNHEYDGKKMPWANDTGSDVLSGQVVVIGALVGVAQVDIPDEGRGDLAIDEVYSLPKVTGTIGQGVDVYWLPTGDPVDGVAGSGAITTSATGATPAGRTFGPALEGDATVMVKLNS